MARHVWTFLLVIGVLAEVRSLRRRDGATLSETTRAAFFVHTRPGRIVFATCWTGLWAWYLAHINRR